MPHSYSGLPTGDLYHLWHKVDEEVRSLKNSHSVHRGMYLGSERKNTSLSQRRGLCASSVAPKFVIGGVGGHRLGVELVLHVEYDANGLARINTHAPWIP